MISSPNTLRAFAIISLVLGTEVFAQDEAERERVPLPRSMGALGDSMTAAALANFKRQDGIWPWSQAYLAGEAAVLGVLFGGFGTDAAMKVVDRRHLSWATGIDPLHRMMSHGSRLNYMTKGNVKLGNFAISGAHAGPREGYRSNLVDAQLPNLLQWSRETLGQEAPDYVVILIGANDICEENTDEMTPVNVYQNRVATAVDTVLARNPASHVLISSIPNIEALRETAREARLMPPVLSRCEDVWKMAYAKHCGTLTMEADPLERQKISQRVREYNFALKDIADSRSAQLGDRVRFAEKTYEAQLTPDLLSVDCFHPNPLGQDLIAASTWESSWWTDEWKQSEAGYRAQRAAEIREAQRRACRARQSANPKGPQGGC